MSSEPSSLVPLQKLEKNCDSFIEKLSEFDEDTIITRSNCKFCHHLARQEAEEQFERTASYAPVQRFFEKYNEEHPESPKMYFRNIKSHLDHHYAQQEKKLRIGEYCKWLNEILQEKRQKEQTMDALFASAEMKYLEIAADNTMEAYKQVDSLVKLGKLLLEINRTQAEIKGELKPINVLVDKVINVWSHAIKSEEDPKVQRKLMEVLENMHNEMQVNPMSE